MSADQQRRISPMGRIINVTEAKENMYL